MRIKIIGLGGIGSNLAGFLARYLNYLQLEENISVALIDGDEYEEKNKERQTFRNTGNKAMITATNLAETFRNVTFHGMAEYITLDNVEYFLEEGEIIFLAVDNHQTRKIVAYQCSSMKNVILISGGNELEDGNVLIHIRRGGKEITPPITYLHPEIEEPKDKLPMELSCEERARSEPQLFFTNLDAAIIMCLVFRRIIECKEDFSQFPYTEVYFDINTCSRRAVKREKTE